MQNLHVTLGLVPEFRRYRMATKGGDDVLSLYDTLYRAYVSLPMLRRSGIASVPPLGSGDTGGQMTTSICPSSLADHFDVPLPSDSLAGLSNAASLDNVAILVENEAKRARKLELRHENRRNKRKNAPPPKRPERPGFGFCCTLCVQVPSYFNRNGLLGHLWEINLLFASSWSDFCYPSKSTHKSKASRLNELDRTAIDKLLQPSQVTDDDFKSQVASYLDL